MISSIAKLSSKSLSADNTINAENQSSNMVERRRFLIIRTRLIARSALQLVMGSDTRILYRQVKLGHPDSYIMIRRGLIKPYSAQFSGFAWSFVSSSSDSKSSNSPFTVLPSVVRVKLDVDEGLEELDKSSKLISLLTCLYDTALCAL